MKLVATPGHHRITDSIESVGDSVILTAPKNTDSVNFGDSVNPKITPGDHRFGVSVLPGDHRFGDFGDPAKAERAAISRRGGKWADPSVPKTGWTVRGIGDFGEMRAICEMCESAQIRFSHFATHPDYPDTLNVGCICAGRMEGNPSAARDRETSARNVAGRRARWLTRGWRVSRRGNTFLKARGWHVVVFPRGRGWAALLTPASGEPVPSRRIYVSQDAAKLAAFDEIERRASAPVALQRGRPSC